MRSFGCGIPELGIGLIGISLAFGLAVLTIIYSLGHISGAHLNPAVSIGLWIGGRFSSRSLLPYIVAQILGGLVAAAILYVIATGNGSEIGNFAANGYGEHSLGGYSMTAALITEIILTFMFLMIILGATDKRVPTGFAGMAIGFALTLIHLISIPATNTSANPARSISQAVFVGDWVLQQLWLFIAAPIAGAILAGMVYQLFREKDMK